MMKKITLATGNAHKTEEVQSILGDGYKVLDLSQFSPKPEIVEDAETFEGNADLKALAIAGLVDHLVIADDSGLAVDALGGEPGIYSARYAGEEASMEENKEKLLQKLSQKEERSARFVCVISVAQEGKVIQRFRGECEGEIIEEESGQGGFGYDPLFKPEGYELTFAELSSEKKNELSHRGKAMKQFMNWLNEQEA